MDATAAGLPLFGSSEDTFRLDALFADSPEAAEDPFVPLGDGGPFSRVLLGRIAAGAGAAVRHLAVKVQRSAYRPVEGSGRLPLTNARIDAAWKRERDHLLRAASPETAALLDLGEDSFRRPPLTFCRKTRKHFSPFCPACGGPLTDCRDDALLKELGLSPYSSTTVRYLHCAACAAAKKGALVLYTGTPEETPRGAAEVRGGGRLIRDLGALLREGGPRRGPEDLAARFPCAACEHRAECYPAGAPAAEGQPIPAEDLLAPFSFHEFHVLPLEALHLHLDELVDLLGGAAWSQVKERAIEDPGSAGRKLLLDPLEASLSSPAQFLFRDVSPERFALEALRLKTIAFTQACRALRAYHAACGGPYLDLTPSSLMARIPASGRGLPARWSFRVQLIDLAGAEPFQPFAASPELLGDLHLPPAMASRTYAAPAVREGLAARDEPMRVTIRALRPEKSALRLEVEAQSPQARLRDFRPRDAVRIVPANPLLFQEKVAFWGTLDEAAEHGFRATVFLPRAPRKLEELKTPFAFDGVAALHRRLGMADDLYSLGMLLFRSLLVNDGRDVFEVDDALQRVLRKARAAIEDSPGSPGPSLQAAAERALSRELKREQAVFDPAAVLHRRAEREAAGPAIAARLWSDLLALGFRLLGELPGLSFAGDRAAASADPPSALLDRVLAELESLDRRIHVELFGKEERDREIAAVLREAIAEATAGITGGAGEPARPASQAP